MEEKKAPKICVALILYENFRDISEFIHCRAILNQDSLLSNQTNWAFEKTKTRILITPKSATNLLLLVNNKLLAYDSVDPWHIAWNSGKVTGRLSLGITWSWVINQKSHDCLVCSFTNKEGTSHVAITSSNIAAHYSGHWGSAEVGFRIKLFVWNQCSLTIWISHYSEGSWS